ncbi:MAG: DUF1810 domain-containing protein [Sphingobacteriales bacterium]|nr:MAG: DUF1810 domain-containing protein [Sphingobacteriales bacterium]
MSDTLQRFVLAQREHYDQALSEIKAGRKKSHWMWYIFPQISGLGLSETAIYYAIADKAEASAYLQHDLLGARLVEISRQLLVVGTNDPVWIFGQTDSMKLRSSMTLFASLEQTDPVFEEVLQKFFHGHRDERTVNKLGSP